jgi:hypothetical protein
MKKSTFLFFTFFLFSVMANGCTPASTLVPTAIPPEPTSTPIVYNVRINVVDEKDNPIPDAKIIHGETVEFTDNQGIWQKTIPNSELSVSIWAQGYLLQKHASIIKPGDNKINIQLSTDPNGLQRSDLTRDGYKLVFIEDFQDNISDCIIDGNGNVYKDDTKPGNYLLLVDLRNLDTSFSCSFGPTNIENAIIEVDFRYPDIRYKDYSTADKTYNFQGYFIELRDNFAADGYPLQVPWGPTLQITDMRDNSNWKFPVSVRQAITEKRWYRLNAKYDGVKMEVRMDGKVRFSYLRAPVYNNKTPSSVGAYGQAHIQFDNIKMWIPNN